MAGLALALTATTLAHAVGTAQTSARERGMYVSVLDGEGAAVTGLGPADFVVREDGAQREVVRAEPAAAPMQIAILIDTSEATNNAMQDIRPAVRSFVERMHERNEIALITFGDSSDDPGGVHSRPGPSHEGPRPDVLAPGYRLLPPRRAVRHDARISPPRGGSTRHPRDHGGGSRVQQPRPRPGPRVAPRQRRGAACDRPGRRRRSLDGPSGARPQHRVERWHRRDRGATRQPEIRLGGEGGGSSRQRASCRGQYLVEYVRPETLVPPETIEVAAKDPALMARGNPVLTTQMP